jgi:hypothetical protein
MTETDSRNAIERVWAQVLADPRPSLEQQLDPSDLHTLLMSVSKARASAVTPARLMHRWQHDRFVRPSAADPRRLWRVEARLWELLPDEFDAIDLSPVAPLGTCSAMAPVDQHRIISTTRGSEVLSDPTNVLALEAAFRRKRDPTRPVHLAACHRVIRAQPFQGEGLFQHFRLLVLLSSGRDRGSGSTEADMLTSHLRYWIHAVTDTAPGTSVISEFTCFDSRVLLERFHDTVVGALEPLLGQSTVREDPTRQRARGYYQTGAIRIAVERKSQLVEIGDGGFTDWTAKLMADNKERCLISSIATERLTALATRNT